MAVDSKPYMEGVAYGYVGAGSGSISESDQVMLKGKCHFIIHSTAREYVAKNARLGNGWQKPCEVRVYVTFGSILSTKWQSLIPVLWWQLSDLHSFVKVLGSPNTRKAIGLSWVFSSSLELLESTVCVQIVFLFKLHFNILRFCKFFSLHRVYPIVLRRR